MASNGFSISTLVAHYDQGCLVPFIGSGICAGPRHKEGHEAGACVNWTTMVDALRETAGLKADPPGAADTGDANARRAGAAVLALSCQGTSLADALRGPLYQREDVFGRNELLAQLRWPLICTTNYDDTYFGARLKLPASLERARRKGEVKLPRIYGRSELDCRRVLQHLVMPAGEAYWAIQGMLKPREVLLKPLLRQAQDDEKDADSKTAKALRKAKAALKIRPGLEDELVVGPVEYRAAANRAPHFRRAFAELYYHRSLLFLGSGLGEPYLLALFDEVVELLGTPPRPHFALVPGSAKIDPDYLRSHYNIVCRTYDSQKGHGALAALLDELVAAVKADRPRVRTWGFHMDGAGPAAAPDAHFTVDGSPLPERPLQPQGEILAVSLGRKDAGATDPRGTPRLGKVAKKLSKGGRSSWLNEWLVEWPDAKGLVGVVAREPGTGQAVKSRALRSTGAVRSSFRACLDHAGATGITLVRSQLLATGEHRTFASWVALAQMARAYGEWYAAWREAPAGERPARPLRVVVHVVKEDTLALLRRGELGLAERLAGNREIRFAVEVIDALGRTHAQQVVMDEDRPLGEVGALTLVAGQQPAVGVLPTGRPGAILGALSFDEVLEIPLKDFGVVTGSTLVVNYQAAWPKDAAQPWSEAP